MKTKLVFFILLLSNLSVFSQEKYGSWTFEIWDDYFYKGSPTIETTFGQTHLSLKNSDIDFNKPDYFGYGLLDLKLGYTYEKKSKYSKKITDYRNSYAFVSIISPNLKLSNQTNSNNSTYRFGLGTSSGYGYRFNEKVSLLLNNSSSFTWTRYDAGITAIEFSSSYYEPIQPFNESFRFGSSTQAGIMIPVSSIINFNISFDRTLVFPRHLFWKYAGSYLIELTGQSMIDQFVKNVLRSSPYAGPIVNFLLKNGLSYVIYELRKTKMNWPFESEAPLLFDTFGAGLVFKF